MKYALVKPETVYHVAIIEAEDRDDAIDQSMQGAEFTTTYAWHEMPESVDLDRLVEGDNILDAAPFAQSTPCPEVQP